MNILWLYFFVLTGNLRKLNQYRQMEILSLVWCAWCRSEIALKLLKKDFRFKNLKFAIKNRWTCPKILINFLINFTKPLKFDALDKEMGILLQKDPILIRFFFQFEKASRHPIYGVRKRICVVTIMWVTRYFWLESAFLISRILKPRNIINFHKRVIIEFQFLWLWN